MLSSNPSIPFCGILMQNSRRGPGRLNEGTAANDHFPGMPMPSSKQFFALFMLVLIPSLSLGQRDTLDLTGRWSFAVDSLHQGLLQRWYSTGLPSKLTQSVTVPHTWNSMQNLETYAGTGWYERTVTVPGSWKGKRIVLQFSAVYHDASVWINGKKAGGHIGSGFTPFQLEVSELVHPGGKDVIRVAASNSYSRNSIPFERSFDWPNDGGIIRPVALVAMPLQSIGGLRVSGIPVDAPRAPSRGKAHISFELQGTNSEGWDGSSYQLIFRCEPFTDEKPLCDTSFVITPLQRQCTQTIDLPQVEAWSFDAPNLYSLEVRLRRGNVLVDRVTAVFGFREIRTDGERLVLNGEQVRLMGVEWMPGSSLAHGMAETKDELIGMLEKLRGVNAIFTRFHWQQDDAVFDWCDRHGVLVQEEVPLWGGATPLNDTILTLAQRHLDEMIRAHGNHPSIVMWGVGNELASREPAIVQGVRQLYRYTRALDPTRLVNYVSNKAAFSGGRDAIREGDVLMFNEYQDTWYQGDPARLGNMLDTLHLEYPGRPIVISEYGLCEPAFQGGDERRSNDMIYHTAVYESRSYIAGAIYFCLNDYRTHVGEAGEGILKRRVHGVYDLQGNAKRSAGVLRRMSSPIKVINVPWKGSHLIELKLVGGGGLPRHTCTGYSLYWSRPGEQYLSGQRVAIPELRANGSTHVYLDEFSGDTVVATLVRPTGEVVDSWELALDRKSQ